MKNLVVFEVASRSRSFTAAAAELGISRVAVSRQIAELEREIGKPLFVRLHREVALTTAGEAFAALVNPALDRIEDALSRQRWNANQSRLSVTVTSAFATYWLMPRLVDFGAKNPEIEVNLVVSDRYLDLEAEGIDVAIRYLPERPEGPDWSPLFKESIFPVFSPRYPARTELERAEDLLNERLLYLSGKYRAEARWSHWFREQGLNPPEERMGIQVNTYINMLQAAIEGQGVALAGHPLVDRFLDDGSLQRIEAVAPLPRLFFYLHRRSDAPDAQCFCAWLMETARQQQR
ncbi:MAG: LysR substrate-binding domain-containing protein [Pseudomonadota bacterium]